MPGLTCQELIGFLDDYVAGTQPSGVRDAFESHLRLCAHCREYLETYRGAVRLGREAATTEETAATMPEALVRAILQSRPRDGA